MIINRYIRAAARHAWRRAFLALCLCVSGLASAAENGPYLAALDAARNWDYGQALALFRQAALAQDRRAERNLGLMLLYGERLYGPMVARNSNEAVTWLERASRDGDELAGFILRAGASERNR